MSPPPTELPSRAERIWGPGIAVRSGDRGLPRGEPKDLRLLFASACSLPATCWSYWLTRSLPFATAQKPLAPADKLIAAGDEEEHANSQKTVRRLLQRGDQQNTSRQHRSSPVASSSVCALRTAGWRAPREGPLDSRTTLAFRPPAPSSREAMMPRCPLPRSLSPSILSP